MNGTDIINSEAFLNLPLGWQIFFGIIITFCLIFGYLFAFKGFRTLMVNFFKKVFHIARQEPLLMHDLFFNKERYHNMIYKLNFDLKKKTELFRIITLSKVDTTIRLTKEFIKENNKDFDEYSPQQLRALLYSLRNKILKQSNQEATDQFIRLYDRGKGLKLWGLIYESEGGYRKYWEEKNKFLDMNIERLVDSKRSNRESVRSILTQIDIAVDLAILDCEVTFYNLNGQIAELIKE